MKKLWQFGVLIVMTVIAGMMPMQVQAADGPCVFRLKCPEDSTFGMMRRPDTDKTWMLFTQRFGSDQIKMSDAEVEREIRVVLEYYGRLDSSVPWDYVSPESGDDIFQMGWADREDIRRDPKNREGSYPVGSMGLNTTGCLITTAILKMAYNPTLDGVVLDCWSPESCLPCEDCDRHNLDLESMLTHEFGHGLGLAHTLQINATMYPRMWERDGTNLSLLPCEKDYLVAKYANNPAAHVTSLVAERQGLNVLVQWDTEGEALSDSFYVESAATLNSPRIRQAAVKATNAGRYSVMLGNLPDGLIWILEREQGGEVIAQAAEPIGQPVVIAPPTELPAAFGPDSSVTELLAQQPFNFASLASGPRFYIFVPDTLAAPADYLADWNNNFRALPTEVKRFSEVPPAMIPSFVQTNLPNGGYDMVVGPSFEGGMRANDALYQAAHMVRDSFPVTMENLVQLSYVPDTAHAAFNMSYFTPFNCNNAGYMPNHRRIPNRGYAVGSLMVDNLSDFWYYVNKRIRAEYHRNPYAPVYACTYARNGADNIGVFAKELMERLLSELPSYATIRSAADTDSLPWTSAQRDAWSMEALANAQACITISGLSSGINPGGFYQLDQNTRPEDIPADSYNPVFWGFSCDIGDGDRNINPAKGRRFAKRALFAPGGPVIIIGPSRGTWQLANYHGGRLMIRGWLDHPGKAIGNVFTDGLNDWDEQFPEDSSVARSYILHGDPTFVPIIPAIPVVRVIDPVTLGLTLSTRPNPAHGRVRVSFTLPVSDQVALTVYDLQGRKVRMLQQGRLASGRHTVVWTGETDAGVTARSSIYYLRLQSGMTVRTQTIVWVR